jgi:hypothetical protein
LERYSGTEHEIYDFRFDYNFNNLRASSGEIYFRSDISNHPGYWGSIVEPAAEGFKKRSVRTKYNWREHDKRWLSPSGTDWRKRFEDLLNKVTPHTYGLNRKADFDETVYEGSKPCAGIQDAKLVVEVKGYYETKIDYGFSIIGTLKSFKLTEAYGYLREVGPEILFHASIEGSARLNIQSDFINLLKRSKQTAGINIKGIVQVGPYFDVGVQLGATGLLDGRLSFDASLGSPVVDHIFPINLGVNGGDYYPKAHVDKPTMSSTRSGDFDGNAILSLKPVLGFRLRLLYGDTSLMDTSV